MKKWRIEARKLTDGSSVFDVVAYVIGAVITIHCESRTAAVSMAAYLNDQALSVEVS